MRPQLLLRMYPRAWRERYGEELSAMLDSQGTFNITALGDLLHGALAAHFQPLDRSENLLRSSNVNSLPPSAVRLVVIWTPLAIAAAGAAMVLIDFWFGHGSYRLLGFSPGLSRLEELGLPRVRIFEYPELYDLALHLAMLAVAIASALVFAALARRAVSAGRPSV